MICLSSRVFHGMVCYKFITVWKKICCFHLDIRRHRCFFKRRQSSTRLHGVTPQNKAISFIWSSPVRPNGFLRQVSPPHLHCILHSLKIGTFGSMLCAYRSRHCLYTSTHTFQHWCLQMVRFHRGDTATAILQCLTQYVNKSICYRRFGTNGAAGNKPG